MAKITPSEVVGKIVEMLGDMSSEERQRVVQASLTLLGEAPLKTSKIESPNREHAESSDSLSARGRTWAKQNGVSAEQIQQVFHIVDGKAEVIASDIPGSGKKEKTLNAYVLTGLANYLSSGEANFSDDVAKAFCTSAGCLDKSNHAAILKAKGNDFAGSKERGWTITGPGLKRAAELVKQIAS